MSDSKDAPNETATQKPSRGIAVLPQEVVDQIAAGEVVQRPVSVVKELLENCLDAGSTHIIVHVEKGGLSKLTVTDDGCGISKADLAMAAKRHATSKFISFEDFAVLQTFGFRGEALASISMVSRLTVTTRIAESNIAFTQTYRNGAPTTQQPKPCARKQGTTIMVQDLFYNVPHRLKTYSKRESDEYSRILDVVQSYAIRYPHTGFVCQRTRSGSNKTVMVDVNTSQLKHVKELMKSKSKEPSYPTTDAFTNATKEVMSHVFESNLEPYLSHFDCSETGEKATEFSCACHAYFTSPSFEAKGTKFVLFLNDRLVDLPVLKRAMEDVYAQFTKSKPIIAVSVTVPGTQVDVNVHPSKRQVALVYQEELCTLICGKLRQTLQEYGQSFHSQSVAPVENPYKRRRQPAESSKDDDENQTPKKIAVKKRTPPSQLVRTNKATPVGAIEPFLVSTQPPPSQSQLSQSPTTALDNPSTPSSQKDNFTHKSDCPISSSQPTTIDMSQPGAFAEAFRCYCAPDETRRQVLVKKAVVRPKRVIPTKCSYTSISFLRKRVNKQASTELAKQLRDAYFVGVLSHQRSLVQCGEQLVMINHLELAKELFYQLALARFGGAVMATFGSGGVNVRTVIAQALQLEDDLILCEEHKEKEMRLQKQDLLEVSETNENLSEQATACLLENASMLEEYFMMRIEKQDDDVILTGLPVLLDGHAPEPHGLAIFLLRLATQVDWAEER